MNTEKNELSMLALANVEALAGSESGASMTCDGNGSKWCPITSSYVYKVTTSVWG